LAESVKLESPKKQTLKEAKKKIVSDEESNIKITDDNNAIQPICKKAYRKKIAER
jgi:hypothetical protein